MKKYRVPALEKAIAILDLLEGAEHNYSVTEIHTTLNIPKATAFMLLNVLEDCQVVSRHNGGRYSLGPKIYTLGMSYMAKTDLKKIARPHLEQLAAETGFTCHLGILSNNQILFVDKVELPTFIKFTSFPGMHSQLHTTSMGKALVAFLPEKERDSLIEELELGSYTLSTITDKAKFRDTLQRIHDMGYAIEDEEGELGIRSIGAPVFNIELQVVAAVSVAALKSQIHVDHFQFVGGKVMEAARSISTDLGCIESISLPVTQE